MPPEPREASDSGTGRGSLVPHPRTVLVVDDEPDMLENMCRIFRRSPFACVCVLARNGHEALAVLERDPPDLVLTDLRMPGMDGLTLLRQIRRVAPRTPVIIFTAYATESAAEEAFHAGAAAFLAKPFSAAQLLGTVQQALENSEASPT